MSMWLNTSNLYEQEANEGVILITWGGGETSTGGQNLQIYFYTGCESEQYRGGHSIIWGGGTSTMGRICKDILQATRVCYT